MFLDNNHLITKFIQLASDLSDRFWIKLESSCCSSCKCKMSTAKQQTAILNITATANHKNLLNAIFFFLQNFSYLLF